LLTLTIDNNFLCRSILFAVFRTLNRMYAKPEQAEAPETLVFRDPWIVGSFLLWALSVFVIFYTHF
jgi:hypothetical protein